MAEEHLLNIYTEKASIKRYSRKTKEGTKEFNQLNLGYTSEFEKDENVVILRESDWNELTAEVRKLKELKTGNEDMKMELEEVKKENRNLLGEVKSLNEDMKNELDLRSKIIFNYERVISDIQDKTLYKLFNMKLPNSYKLLDEFKDKEAK